MCMYRNICDKAKLMLVHNTGIRTDDLVTVQPTKQPIIPLYYDSKHFGDINGSYMVYTHCADHSRSTVPTGVGRPARIPPQLPLRPLRRRPGHQLGFHGT